MTGEKMNQSDAARIQSANAKNGGDTGKDSFTARAQAAGDKNANEGGKSGTPGGGKTGGGGSTPSKSAKK